LNPGDCWEATGRAATESNTMQKAIDILKLILRLHTALAPRLNDGAFSDFSILSTRLQHSPRMFEKGGDGGSWPTGLAALMGRRVRSLGYSGRAGQSGGTALLTHSSSRGLLRPDPQLLDDRPPFVGIGLH
jgi:hypothetical protein